MEKAIYIHVEGMDLAGKSTLVKNAKLHNPTLETRHNSILPNGDNLVYQLADNIRKSKSGYDSVTLGNLYVTALGHDIRNFKPLLIDTLQDSTIFLRSMAYYEIKGNTNFTSELLRLFREFNHPIFDNSVILTASIEQRKQRLAQRYAEAPEEVADDDLMIINDPIRFIKMEQVLIDLGKKHFNSRVIDTTNLTPLEVYNESKL